MSFITRVYFVELVSSVLTSPQFLLHKLTETVLPTSIAESTAALSDPATHALELAHALAFRSSGLGSSFGSSQYFGGETRVDAHGSGQATFVRFGVPGAAPKLAALHAHLNRTPALKWVAGSSPLAGIGTVPVYVPYSDAAMFGVLVRADTAAEASKGVKAVV
ncbi:ubiquinol-cytochrome c reductase core subunit 1 [Ceratobasidium sp. 414]|nr:ubiquinol-cytochrome c reductase core subunit 1 [Ceratobasidium sp. 414]